MFFFFFEEYARKTYKEWMDDSVNAGSMMVLDSFAKATSVFRRPYKNIICSVSGGSDSDLVVDLCKKFDPDNKRVTYVWVDTGIEYQATKDHLDYLEKRYDIKIIREKAKMPIPMAVRYYGQPFVSKRASEYIHRLQLHNFTWEDKPYDVLIEKYPNCEAALKWWCNENGEGSQMNIDWNKGLKEFMIANPPTFAISNMCCQKTKKDTIADVLEFEDADLNIIGIRKAEGGVRASIKTCYSFDDGDYDTYRPLFWYKKEDKEAYEKYYKIQHSKCYTEYGLCRTGCVGCPFGRDFEEELKICDTYEPKLSKACRNIFKDSYEYTRKYREFRRSAK